VKDERQGQDKPNRERELEPGKQRLRRAEKDQSVEADVTEEHRLDQPRGQPKPGHRREQKSQDGPDEAEPQIIKMIEDIKSLAQENPLSFQSEARAKRSARTRWREERPSGGGTPRLPASIPLPRRRKKRSRAGASLSDSPLQRSLLSPGSREPAAIERRGQTRASFPRKTKGAGSRRWLPAIPRCQIVRKTRERPDTPRCSQTPTPTQTGSSQAPETTGKGSFLREKEPALQTAKAGRDRREAKTQIPRKRRS